MVGNLKSELMFYDIMEDQVVSTFKLMPDSESAINALASHGSRNLIFAGHENGSITVFDFQEKKVI